MDFTDFQERSSASRRVLVLVGAGLSAASGLETFRGPSCRAVWRDLEIADLATPEAFDVDPRLVWQFWASRRQEALAAVPNGGHKALAKSAELWGSPRVSTSTQNVDNSSEAAGHPADELVHMHGESFVVKCTQRSCNFQERNFDPKLGEHYPPSCPRCQSVSRPGVTWFGEPSPYSAIVRATDAIESSEIDSVSCVGMSAEVWPAAGYIDEVVSRGARVAVFNPDDAASRPDAWFFKGSAHESLPEALRPIIGSTESSNSEKMSDVELSDVDLSDVESSDVESSDKDH